MKHYSKHRGTKAAMGLVAAGLLALAAGSAVADVALHPGTVKGLVALSGFPSNSGTISINNNDFSASGNLTEGAYTLTTEGNQTYNNISTRLDFNNNNTQVYENLYNYVNNAGINVTIGGTVTHDVIQAAGTIVGHITVTGGSVSRSHYQASVNSNTGSNYGYVNRYQAGDTPMYFPANASISVNGGATINIFAADGVSIACTTDVNFGQQQLALDDAGSVNYDNDVAVDPAICSANKISGLVGIHHVPGGVIQSSAYVYASGPSYKAVSIDNTANPIADLAYEFIGIAKGNYYMGAYLYFPAPFNGEYIYLPNQNPPYVNLTNGGAATRDFLFDGGIAVGKRTLSGPAAGFATSGQQNFQGVYDYNQSNYGPTAGGNANAQIDLNTGTFKAILTPGTWTESYSYYNFSQSINGNQCQSTLQRSESINVPVQGEMT